MREELEKLADRLTDIHISDHRPGLWAKMADVAEKLRSLAERLPTEKEVMTNAPEIGRPVAPPPSDVGGGDQVPLPEPFAWYILVREKDDGYFVDDLDDAQAIDDMTNHAAKETPMFSGEQLRAHREEYAAARVAAEGAEWGRQTLRMHRVLNLGLYQRVEAAERERDEARAEAEGLRKDAERYRLLRSAPHHTFVTRCVGGATIPRFEGDALDRLTDAILANRGGDK